MEKIYIFPEHCIYVHMVFLIDAIKKENYENIILDLTLTISIDSAIIGVLLSLHNEWFKNKRNCVLLCSPEVLHILSMMGVDKFLLGKNHE